MSKVRALVGTRKGAFILTADGKRKKWKVSSRTSPAGNSITSKDRLPNPEPNLCFADERMVWPNHSALRRWRQNVAPAWNSSRRNRRTGTDAQRREQ